VQNFLTHTLHKLSKRTLWFIVIAIGITLAILLVSPKGRLSLQQRLDLTIKEVTVSGRKQTELKQIAEMLPLGKPLFAFSPSQIKEQLENTTWVKSAEIHRSLKGKISIRLKEYTPFALWKSSPPEKLALIDEDGAIIGSKQAGDFPNLIVIQSEHSQSEAPQLLKALVPIKGHSIKALSQSGASRWNVELANGITILLPEKEPQLAWHKLGEFNRNNRLLERNLKSVDMRIQDRLIVSLKKSKSASMSASKSAKSKKKSGKGGGNMAGKGGGSPKSKGKSL